MELSMFFLMNLKIDFFRLRFYKKWLRNFFPMWFPEKGLKWTNINCRAKLPRQSLKLFLRWTYFSRIQVSSSLGQLEELTGQYEMVSKKTTELHVACQHLLQEQTKLSETNNILQEKLKVFQVQSSLINMAICNWRF